MTQKSINLGTADQGNGDPLRVAFGKVNDNFTELYTALGLIDNSLNLGAFEFTGSVMTTTDSTAIVIDQATTITSNLSVGGDILPQTALGGDLGSAAKPWRSLYVSNNTIFLGGVPLGIDANGNLTVNGSQITGGSVSSLVNGANTLSLGSDGELTLPGGRTRIGTLMGSDAIIANEDEAFGVVTQGTNASSVLLWIEDLENFGTSNLAAVYVNSGGPGSIRIATGANGGPGPNHWEFNRYGVLTLPNGSTIGDGEAGVGVPITTARGTILLGNLAECAGGESHFHIMPAGQQAIDLFLGDDYNYVKLPSTGGVEISSSEIGAQHYWTFGTDGSLTLPTNGTISYAPDDTDHWNEPTVNTIQAALDELAARVTAFENYEIDGGNAYTPALGELLIDGNGA